MKIICCSSESLDSTSCLVLVRGGGWLFGRACCGLGLGFEWQGHVTAVQGVIFGIWVSASRQKS